MVSSFKLLAHNSFARIFKVLPQLQAQGEEHKLQVDQGRNFAFKVVTYQEEASVMEQTIQVTHFN